jgi:hypothetical protein
MLKFQWYTNFKIIYNLNLSGDFEAEISKSLLNLQWTNGQVNLLKFLFLS